MNRVDIVGRLVRDPEVNYKTEKPVARFTVAAQRTFKNREGKYDADFINCVAFGKTAEIVEKHFFKGGQIGLSGRINTGSYTNKEGQKIYTTDVAVDSVEFVGSRQDNGSGAAAEKPSAKADDDGFLNIPDSVDDLPFVN